MCYAVYHQNRSFMVGQKEKGKERERSLYFHFVRISYLRKVALLKENKCTSITRIIVEMIAKLAG